MPVRPSLIRSIPFWILVAVSAVLAGIGAWLVIDRLTTIDSMLRSSPADQAGQLDQAVAVYGGPPTVTAGAVLLGAGLIGLLLALTVATIRTLLPAPVEVESLLVEEFDDDALIEPAPVEVVEPVADAAPDPQIPASVSSRTDDAPETR